MPGRIGPSALRPSLPQSLLDQIDESGANVPGRENKNLRHKFSRKDARKQERLNRKKRKSDFLAGGPTSHHNNWSAHGEHAESPERGRVRIGEPEHMQIEKFKVDSEGPKKPASRPVPRKPDLKPKSKTALEKLVSRSNRPPITPFSRSKREREDDAYIAFLEGKLGKRKKSAEGDDGLDDLLNFTSSIVPSSKEESSDDSVDGENGRDDEETRCLHVSDDGGFFAEEWGGIESSIANDDDEEVPTLLPAPDEAHITGSRYVPPHLRNRSGNDDGDSELLVRLTRELKGLLNRMSEQNMAAILDSIEEVYRNHRRHDVTSTLTTLIIDGISSHSILLDSYVVLYAAFVSSLHKIVGVEFAAYFVQHVVSSYETQYSALRSASQSKNTMQPEIESEVLGKECSNLIVLLSELYNFQVISSVLVFDIIRNLLDQKLTEFSVELLLKIVRNSGQQLRQDDPSALKDIIGIVQTKLSNQDDFLSSRTRFMIETLTNLKNNKVKRTAGQQHQGGEAVERMKKFLSGMAKKRHVLTHEPLRVSLEDLHTAESKGKWWLVGAAWGGDPLVDRQDFPSFDENAESSDMGNGTLLKLARKQGMNTDIRRSIFIVLMSSDDYVDACERLSQLNLTEVQQREIIRVILRCCGNEKSYNPYYTLTVQHLCRTSHSYKVTLQFYLWDFLRDLGEITVGGAAVIKNLKENDGFDVKNVSGTRLANIAKAYGWWIAKDCCTLSILKPIDFTLLKPRTTGFLSDLFTQLFIATQTTIPVVDASFPTTRNRGALEEVFIKAMRIEALAQGLIHFLSNEILNGQDGQGLVKWAIGVAVDTLRTGMNIIPTL